MFETGDLGTTVVLLIGLVAVFAGSLGSAMGIGGGLILVPVLISVFSIDTEHARAASLIAVAVTSIGGSLVYLREGSVDSETGAFLQAPTAIGAIIGAFVGSTLDPNVVRVLFSALLLAVAARLIMLARSESKGAVTSTSPFLTRHRWLIATLGCLLGGIVSSLLGVGGGIIFVPLLALALNKSARVSAATSTYLIGLTGAASALIYVRKLTQVGPDETLVALAIPTAIGVFIGSQIGARASRRLAGPVMRYAFAALMVVNAGLLMWKVVHG
jgi:uncharacterized membrane protein YfcA